MASVGSYAVMRESEKTLRVRLGRELRKARLAQELTQADVAERVSTDPETISRFERGATLPSLVRLLDLAEALDVTVASLLGGPSPRATDELAELGQMVAHLPPKDRKLVTAVVTAIVDARKS